MGSVRVALTQKHVADALAVAEIGTTSLEDWTDTREVGLRIRVRGRKAVWLLRFNDSSVTLGPAGRWTPKQAREMAGHVRGMLKSDLDPRPWVDARLAGADAVEAAGVVLRREGRERQEWTVGEVVRQYVEQHLKLGRVVRGERRPPSARSVQDVESTILRAATFQAISGLLARELDARRLETYRNTVAETNGGSTSRKALSNVKTAMTWAKKHHGAASGLGTLAAWWRDVASTHVEGVRSRMPSVDDLGMTLALADAVQTMPGRKIDVRGSRMHALALRLLVMTAQRKESIATIRRSQIVSDGRDGGDGWGILYLPPAAMKGRKAHTIPLPPAAMEIIRTAIKIGGPDSEFLFPAERGGKAGTAVSVSGSALNRRLAQLRGQDPTGRTRGGRNLLAEAGVRVADWSPHDARRTFATEIEDLTTRGDAVSAVLDHSQAGARFVDATAVPDAAAITRIAYSQAQRLPLKRLALGPWSELVEAAIEQAMPTALKVVGEAVPARPKGRKA